ncbi:MAG: hypothetical protein LBC60_07620, partial [Spirochaetaceae bacterium]|nr:hypothetical protein [Spirochaetaceae bacterium]
MDKKTLQGKIVFTVLAVCVALPFLLWHFRITEYRGKHLFVFTMSPDSATWTLLPQTIRTVSGDIHLKPFTPVSISKGYLCGINNFNNNISHNLVVDGNIINKDILGIDLNSEGKITGLYGGTKTQDYTIDNVQFTIELYNVNEKWVKIVSFDEIILQDGTTITIEEIGPYCHLIMENDEWNLYTRASDYSFLVQNPQWEEPKRLHSLTFKPHF